MWFQAHFIRRNGSVLIVINNLMPVRACSCPLRPLTAGAPPRCPAAKPRGPLQRASARLFVPSNMPPLAHSLVPGSCPLCSVQTDADIKWDALYDLKGTADDKTIMIDGERVPEVRLPSPVQS